MSQETKERDEIEIKLTQWYSEKFGSNLKEALVNMYFKTSPESIGLTEADYHKVVFMFTKSQLHNLIGEIGEIE